MQKDQIAPHFSVAEAFAVVVAGCSIVVVVDAAAHIVVEAPLEAGDQHQVGMVPSVVGHGGLDTADMPVAVLDEH